MTPLDWIRFGVPAVVGAIVGAAIAYQVGHWNGFAAGELATAARLDAATNEALKELANEADRHDFLRRQCIARGGVWEFSAGRCVEGSAE